MRSVCWSSTLHELAGSSLRGATVDSAAPGKWSRMLVPIRPLGSRLSLPLSLFLSLSPSRSPSLALSIALSPHLEADRAHHEAGPVPDLRSCVVDALSPIKPQ